MKPSPVTVLSTQQRKPTLICPRVSGHAALAHNTELLFEELCVYDRVISTCSKMYEFTYTSCLTLMFELLPEILHSDILHTAALISEIFPLHAGGRVCVHRWTDVGARLPEAPGSWCSNHRAPAAAVESGSAAWSPPSPGRPTAACTAAVPRAGCSSAIICRRPASSADPSAQQTQRLRLKQKKALLNQSALK